jgi:hypothetical protein
MIFRQMLPNQELILARIETRTPPPVPVIARRATPTPPASPWFIRLALWLIVLVAPLVAHWPPPVWVINKARFTVLVIVAMAVVEVLAQNHIEKSLGLA